MGYSRYLLCAMVAFSMVHAAPKPEETTPHPIRISARYTSPEGLGYKPGYTTLEGFFASTLKTPWLPFLDLRAHLFDNGRFAANAGAGLRYLGCSRLYGFNAYYDYRNSHRQHYNQASIGFETLGRVWDFRLNGYLPVGAKQSRFYQVKFDKFEGNSMYIRAKREFALKGANAEAGLHVDSYKSAPLYFAAGPYYFTGKGASTWGGSLRARVDFFDGLLSVEGNTSYDHYFHWIGQGQVSLNLSLGKLKKSQSSCPKNEFLLTRSLQRIDRNEIIPLSKQHVHELARDENGKPYFFVFVDNTSSSLGTFESPYASLATAQANSSAGQVIYVFPGDGSATNMSTGITLQDSQMLLGAGSNHPLITQWGTAVIPSFASTQPVITNTLSAPVITLANNNTISGLYIANNTGTGIFGNGITNFNANQNTILGGAVAEGILLENLSGSAVLNDNLLVQTGPNNHPSAAFHLLSSQGTCDLSFDKNTFYSEPNGNNVIGISVELSGTAHVSAISITNTTLTSTATNGPAITTALSDTTQVGDVYIDNCVISKFGTGIEFDVFGTSSVASATLTNITLTNQGYSGFYIDVENSCSMGPIYVSNATVQNAVTYGLVSYTGATATISSLTVANSSFSGSEFGVNPEIGGSGSLPILNVSQCNFVNNLAAVEIDFQSTGSLGTAVITGCSFTNNTGEAIYLNFNAGQSIDNIEISNNYFTSSEYAILSSLMGTIGSLNITDCSFVNNDYGLSLQHASNTTFHASNNVFSGNQNAVNSNAFPAVAKGTISNNQFIGSSTTNLVLPMLTGSTNSLSITDNIFTNITGSAIQGYGAQISTTSGSSLCLEFTGNTATPASSGSFYPYSFNGSSGTFNLTPDSTQANNIGTISSSGTLGSCNIVD